jgi:hypothetical protein
MHELALDVAVADDMTALHLCEIYHIAKVNANSI